VADLEAEIVFWLCYTVLLSLCHPPHHPMSRPQTTHTRSGAGRSLTSAECFSFKQRCPINLALRLACRFRASPQVCSLPSVGWRVGPVNPAAQNEARDSVFARLQAAWAPAPRKMTRQNDCWLTGYTSHERARGFRNGIHACLRARRRLGTGDRDNNSQ
jgi:hypothetical protein